MHLNMAFRYRLALESDDFRGKNSASSLGRKIFPSFLNLPCCLKRNLCSDDPSAIFLEKERLIAGYLKRKTSC